MAQTLEYKFTVGEIVVHVLDEGYISPESGTIKVSKGIITERSQRECYRQAPQNSYGVRFVYQASVASKEAFGIAKETQWFSEIELKSTQVCQEQ